MSVHYPSHLYIRIDRPLRADLLAGAEAAGQTVSEFARGLIRGVIAEQSDACAPNASRTSPSGETHRSKRSG